jgi:hypothetical protein
VPYSRQAFRECKVHGGKDKYEIDHKQNKPLDLNNDIDSINQPWKAKCIGRPIKRGSPKHPPA